MLISRFIPIFVLLAAPVCQAQLPPSVLLPGKPAAPTPPPPVAPVPATPEPAAPAAAAEPRPASSAAPNTLTAEEQAQGWRLLFDGTRVYGMRGVQRADPLAAGWKIVKGELFLPKDVKDMDRMTGGDIITTDQYWDFEFRFDWRSSASGDSGIRYMLIEAAGQTPAGLEYQIIDDIHNSTGLKGGALRRTGALDNLIPVGANARLRSADPLNNIADPWNEGRIVVQGNHVEHWLNGDKVLEFELGPQLRRQAETARMRVPVSFGMKNRTRICILDQGTEIAFRNLKIRPMIPQAVVTPVATPPPGAKR